MGMAPADIHDRLARARSSCSCGSPASSHCRSDIIIVVHPHLKLAYRVICSASCRGTTSNCIILEVSITVVILFVVSAGQLRRQSQVLALELLIIK